MMRNIAVNFFYQAMYQVTLIILPIITIPIVSRALGPDGIGTWNYIQSIMNYFLLLAGLGLANYGVREVAVVRKDKNKLSQIFWELEVFNLFFSSLTLIVYLIVSLFFDDSNLYLVQSLILIGAMFDISWFFAGIEDFKKVTLSGILVKIICFILILLFIKDSNDLILYVFIQSLSVLLSQALLWIFVFKYIAFVKVSFLQVKKHFLPALRFFISKIAMTIYLNLNKTLLGLFTTMTLVGYYSNALTLVTLSGSLITALNTVLIPRMSSTFAKGDEPKLIDQLEKSLHFQLFLTIPICFGIILVSPKLVPWFFGEEFLSITSLVPLLAPVVVVQALQSGIAAQYLIPKNDMKSYNLTVIFGAVISFICNIAFIPIVGVYGAVIATIAGQGSLCLIRVYVLKRDTPFKFNIKVIIIYFICSILMYLVTSYITADLSPKLLTTTLQIVIGFTLYICLTVVLKVNPIYNYIKK